MSFNFHLIESAYLYERYNTVDVVWKKWAPFSTSKKNVKPRDFSPLFENPGKALINNLQISLLHFVR
jgi:hypothetical protein